MLVFGQLLGVVLGVFMCRDGSCPFERLRRTSSCGDLPDDSVLPESAHAIHTERTCAPSGPALASAPEVGSKSARPDLSDARIPLVSPPAPAPRDRALRLLFAPKTSPPVRLV